MISSSHSILQILPTTQKLWQCLSCALPFPPPLDCVLKHRAIHIAQSQLTSWSGQWTFKLQKFCKRIQQMRAWLFNKGLDIKTIDLNPYQQEAVVTSILWRKSWMCLYTLKNLNVWLGQWELEKWEMVDIKILTSMAF